MYGIIFSMSREIKTQPSQTTLEFELLPSPSNKGNPRRTLLHTPTHELAFPREKGDNLLGELCIGKQWEMQMVPKLTTPGEPKLHCILPAGLEVSEHQMPGRILARSRSQ